MKQCEIQQARERALILFDAAGIVLTPQERASIEVADFGLNQLDALGLELVTYINTNRVCAKEMVLFPGQTCPEHCHVPTNGQPGKEETFRCRYGKVQLYVGGEGDDTGFTGMRPDTPVTVFREIVLLPGEQYTIMPGVKHWFRGGENGAVVSEFSTHSTDETDVFTDVRVVREPVVD